MSNKFQRGFGVIEVILIIAIFAVIAFIGWRVYTSQTSAPENQAVVSNETPKVETASDLQKAEQYLSESDIDKELDTSEIDSVLE